MKTPLENKTLLRAFAQACVSTISSLSGLHIWGYLNDRIDRFLTLELPKDPDEVDAIRLEDRYLYGANPFLFFDVSENPCEGQVEPVLDAVECQAILHSFRVLHEQSLATRRQDDACSKNQSDRVGQVKDRTD
jgi:hypothetical protein